MSYFCIDDAVRRYKQVNNTDIDTSPSELFLKELEKLSFELTSLPRISFYSNAVKVKINFSHQEFILDYDYECPESVFISTFKSGKLIVKDSSIDKIPMALGSFL
jgi:hypothetical protein